MDRLSDSILTLLIHRCVLIDRLNRRLHHRSSLLRTYVGLIEMPSKPFTDRYVSLNTLRMSDFCGYVRFATDSLLPIHCFVGIENLGHDTRMRVARVLLCSETRTQSIMRAVEDAFPSATIVGRALIDTSMLYSGDGTEVPENISHATLYYVQSNTTFRHNTVKGMRLQQSSKCETSETRLECPQLKHLAIHCWDGLCDISSCSALATLVQRSCTVTSYPKSLTSLWLHSMRVVDAYKLDLPLLKELQVDVLESDNSGTIDVSKLPLSLTTLEVYSRDCSSLRAENSNLLELFTSCPIQSLPSSLTSLNSVWYTQEVKKCPRLKTLVCGVKSGMTWPDSLTALQLEVREEVTWPTALPSHLRVLAISTLENSVRIPEEWRFNTLVEMDVNAYLTTDQINSISCVEFAIKNPEAEWKHLIAGAQRRRNGMCNAWVDE